MVNGKIGTIIGINGATSTYQVMIDGLSKSYISKDLSKLKKPKAVKKPKDKLKRKKQIKEKGLYKEQNT